MMGDFVRHLFPRVILERNLRLGYTLCLGGLAFTTLLGLAASGLLLLVYYQPTPERAFASILFLESAVWGGTYLRALHRLSSHLFLALMALHTLRVLWTGAWQPPRQLNWVIGCLLLGVGTFEAYTGYLLPLDQLGYWATQTGMTLLATLPAGELLRNLLVPDGVGELLSLLRFYALHIAWLPLGLLLLCLLHFYRVRKNKGVLPYL